MSYMSSPTITGRPLPPDAHAVLFSILSSASIPSCTVTSVARTATEQATVMYYNLVGVGPNQDESHQLSLYAHPGDLVIAVFHANRSLTRAAIIALMAAKIMELGPSTVSHHCADPNVITVFDVAPDSIAKDLHPAFEAAVAADKRVTKFLSPHQADPAYHLEVPRFTVEIPS